MGNAKWFSSSYLKNEMENVILHFKWVFEMDLFEILTQLCPGRSSFSRLKSLLRPTFSLTSIGNKVRIPAK